MEDEPITYNLGTIFVGMLLITLVPSFLVYYFFGFEMGVIFAITFSASVLVTALVGVENTLIHKK